MHKTWQLQEAKSKFSELVSNAESGDVQIVTKRGEDCVAVIPIKQYRIFFEKTKIIDVLLKAPKCSELDIERDNQDTGRDISL